MTVGADGRFSKLRRLAGFYPMNTSSPIDVLWFRLSWREGDPKEDLAARVGSRLFLVFIDRFIYSPLFARAAAAVTDGGTLAAHASLVDREYGIPAVVATGCATLRLRDGQVVTVDGGAGMVDPPLQLSTLLILEVRTSN